MAIYYSKNVSTVAASREAHYIGQFVILQWTGYKVEISFSSVKVALNCLQGSFEEMQKKWKPYRILSQILLCFINKRSAFDPAEDDNCQF